MRKVKESHAISDWKEALHYLEDPDEVFLTIRNEYSSRLNREHRRAMQQWNDIVTRIKPLIEAPIDANVARLTLDAGEATRVRDMARWCVLNACVESEYADVANYGRFSEESALGLSEAISHVVGKVIILKAGSRFSEPPDSWLLSA